jgi:hypothetical protein
MCDTTVRNVWMFAFCDSNDQAAVLGGRLGGLLEVPSHSRSGSLFFQSHNGVYLVKTIAAHEVHSK